MSKIEKAIMLFISILIPLTVGFIGSIFTMDAIQDWYQKLEKPLLNPPDWIFGPVWTTLFILMGLAFFFIWLEKNKAPNKVSSAPFILYFIQIVLNGFWSFLFFGLKSPAYALLEIIVLWIFILLTIISFFKAKKISGYLMLPYILWVSFAVYLNFQFAF